MQTEQDTFSPLNEAHPAGSLGVAQTKLVDELDTLAGVLSPLFPSALRVPRGDTDNAIEYRNIMLLGAQGCGKTTASQSIALALHERYGNVSFYVQFARIDRLLNEGTRSQARCWFIVAEDITLARISKEELNEFFQVRHLISKHTGLRRGIVITLFATHTFHGLDKNLRDTFNALIIKSVPTNPYDRSILKRYFGPLLLDQYSRARSIDRALVWTPEHNHGVLVSISPPPPDSIENTVVRRPFWSRLFESKGR